MGRRKTHAQLNVLINNRPIGRLVKETSGAILFQNDQTPSGDAHRALMFLKQIDQAPSKRRVTSDCMSRRPSATTNTTTSRPITR